jgi:hypothetical protein
VETLFSDCINSAELVNAGVVHQDVQTAIIFDSGVDNSLGVAGLGNIASHRDSLSARCGDRVDYRPRAGLAGSVINNHRSTLCCE